MTKIWIIHTSKVNFIKNKILLFDNIVYIYNINYISNVKRIITNHLIIDLKSKKFLSNNIVSIYGENFFSIGEKMNGNFDEKNISLKKKIFTLYEKSIFNK